MLYYILKVVFTARLQHVVDNKTRATTTSVGGFAVLIIGSSVATGVLIVIKLVIKYVTPYQSRNQKKQTKAFVDKLQRLSETAQTPKLALLFMVVRDIAAPKENGLIASISSDTTSLKRDFVALGKTFK